MNGVQDTDSLHPRAVLAGVASNMRSGLILLDRQEMVTYSNPSAQRLLGISPPDMPGLFDVRQQLLSRAAHPTGAHAELDRLWLHPQEEQTAELEIRRNLKKK